MANEFTTTPAAAVSSTDYVTLAYMELVRGAVNIRKWSRKGGTQATTDIPSVDAARAAAKIEIDGILMRKYPVPLQSASAADTERLRTWAERIASYRLYIGRGLQEDDPLGNQLRTEYTDTIAEIEAFADPAGLQSLDADEYEREMGNAPRLVI